jgi:hypothetical protein
LKAAAQILTNPNPDPRVYQAQASAPISSTPAAEEIKPAPISSTPAIDQQPAEIHEAKTESEAAEAQTSFLA